ncbi:MAG: glycosyltransferase [Bacteroidota bacterium]
MKLLFEILFWCSLFAILHSYLLYPIFIKIASFFYINKLKTNEVSNAEPKVSILLSLYNEETVIEEKILSILNSNYPLEKIEILIGSDCSTDNTNEIVNAFSSKHSNIQFYPYKERQGKPSVINQLYNHSTGSILILTDANVIFDPNTIVEIVKPFNNEEIGLVDTRMINKGLLANGISHQESKYISLEINIKNHESNIWGTMMGPFGGCYAIRKSLYTQVPPNFLVDDFYINMHVLEKGYKAVNCLNAVVFEDVSNNLSEEFRRKTRIATGNFQNLIRFKHLLNGLFGIKTNPNLKSFGLAFSFFSHKVLRWIIPFFIILLFISNIAIIYFLKLNFNHYHIFLICLIISFFVPLTDILLKRININISIFRFLTHFYSMNIAMLIGFFRYIKGVESGIWQPTKRHQSSTI